MDKLAHTEIRYPYAIVRACSELPYVPAFIEMPDGFLRIVLKIVQKINLLNPFSEIFASRQTLADESGKSLDSVHRAIHWLEKQNLIERERIARAGLRGSRSPLVPTKGLLLALGLIDARGAPIAMAKSMWEQPQGGGGVSRPIPLPKHQPGTQDTLETPKSLESGSKDAFTRVGSVCLPTELLWLCSRGLSPFAVLGLMKQARAVGQRLSDVAASAHKYLARLKSNQLFAYIKSLLTSGRDFSAGAREEDKKDQENREIQYLKEKSEIYEGKRFISKKTGKVYQIESGAVRETHEGRSCMAPFTMAFIEAVEAGKLTSFAG